MHAGVFRFADLAPAVLECWEGLCDSRYEYRSPFFAPSFTQAIAEAHDGVFVSVLEDERNRAFFPFQWLGRLGGWRRMAGPAGLDLCDHSGVICGAGARLNPGQLLGASGLYLFRATHMDSYQASLGLPRGRERTGIVINIASAAEYWREFKLRQPGVLSNLRNRTRKAESTFGPLRFEWQTANKQLELERVIEAKRSQYKRTGTTDVFSQRWKREALARLAGLRSASCTGLLSTLYSGDTWLASHFGLVSRSVLHYWFPVYNEAVRQFSPGNILLSYLVNGSAERGIPRIDLGEGVHKYKEWFGNEYYTVFDTVWYAANPGGWLNRAALSVNWRLHDAVAGLRATISPATQRLRPEHS